MTKVNTQEQFPPLVKTIIDGMENIKASNITILNLTELENSVCDYFVIAEGNSNTQVKAISNSVEKVVRETLKDKPWHIEGLENADWILMDYVNTVVHVFKSDIREFYELESLWGDAQITVLENHS